LFPQPEEFNPSCPEDLNNLIKLGPSWEKTSISLLHYPGFMSEGFPALSKSWSIQLETGKVFYRKYGNNPPILHRKETFLPKDHPMVPTFQELTKSAEEYGLFENLSRIGFQNYWRQLLEKKGLEVVGNEIREKGSAFCSRDV
jgi:hypothetical protein